MDFIEPSPASAASSWTMGRRRTHGLRWMEILERNGWISFDLIGPACMHAAPGKLSMLTGRHRTGNRRNSPYSQQARPWPGGSNSHDWVGLGPFFFDSFFFVQTRAGLARRRGFVPVRDNRDAPKGDHYNTLRSLAKRDKTSSETRREIVMNAPWPRKLRLRLSTPRRSARRANSLQRPLPYLIKDFHSGTGLARSSLVSLSSLNENQKKKN